MEITALELWFTCRDLVVDMMVMDGIAPAMQSMPLQIFGDEDGDPGSIV